jgi:DNA-binding NtrC family response regulator
MTNCPHVRILAVHKSLNVDLLLQFVLMLKIRWEISFESNCFDGLQQMQNSEFDVVVLQNELEDMSGLQMIEILRQQVSKIPVILLVGFARRVTIFRLSG